MRSFLYRTTAAALLTITIASCRVSRTLPSAEVELRRNTQALLDAIAPGDTSTWNRLVDSTAIFVDENDVVRTKAQLLAQVTGFVDRREARDIAWSRAAPTR